MFKLLTEEAREKVLSEYRRRRRVVAFVAGMLVLLVANVSFFPSYVVSTFREREVRERAKVAENLELKGDEAELEAWLISTNMALKALDPILDIDRPSRTIEEVTGEKITGINLIAFEWRKLGNTPEISVSGVARDRQALIAFKDRLNSFGKFNEITLPISNLASDKNLNFKISVSPIEK